MIYSIVGWIYETLLYSFNQKKFVNRGFLNGPYCPIYGFGALLDIIILGKVGNPLLLFILGAFVDCSLEYLTSFVMEKLFNARWWDYSDRRFNLNGRVCLLGAVVFGAFSVILIKLVHPFIAGLTYRIPLKILHIVCAALLVIFIGDCIITLMGFTGFNKKLRELSAIIEEKTAEAKKAENLRKNEIFGKRLSFQQRRMIKAFPKLKSVKYDDILTDLKQLIKKIKKEK